VVEEKKRSQGQRKLILTDVNAVISAQTSYEFLYLDVNNAEWENLY
jgi:hypothetical protein